MDGQINLFDYMDEKQNINILQPHITIENLNIIAPSPKPKPKSNRKPRRKNGILYRQTKFYENCEKRIFDGVGMNDIPPIEGMFASIVSRKYRIRRKFAHIAARSRVKADA